jgi:hypothetical protein
MLLRMINRFSARFAAGGIVALALTMPAAAQGPLPASLTQASSLNASQQADVEEFVREQFALIASGSATEIQSARRLLIAPFEQDATSIGFRLACGRAASQPIREILRGSDAHRAANALIVAGRIGTPDTIEALGQGLRDDRSAIRSISASALGGVISSAAPIPIRRAQAETALRLVINAVQVESDPRVAALLFEATSATRETDLQSVAADRVADVLPTVLVNIRDAQLTPADAALWPTALIRSVDLLRNNLIDIKATRNPPANTLKALLTAGGSVMYYASTRVDREPAASLTDSGEAESLQLLVESTERLLEFSERSTTQGLRLPERFEESIEEDDPTAFLDAVQSLLDRLEQLGIDRTDIEG